MIIVNYLYYINIIITDYLEEHVMRRGIFIIVIVGILFFSGISLSAENMQEKKCKSVYSNEGSSINIEIDEPFFWYVLHVNFESPTTVTIRERHTQWRSNETTYEPEIFHGLCIFNPETFQCGYGMGFSTYTPSMSRYVQIDFGMINFSYQDFSTDDCPYSHETNSRYIIHNESGSRYYIFFAYAVKGQYNYWFNTSQPVEIISTAEGKDTFFYHREDFHGKVNIGTNKATCMINGEINIDVEHFLFCWFSQPTMYWDLEDYSGFGKTSISKDGSQICLKLTQTLFKSLPTELATPGYPGHDFFYVWPSGHYAFKSSCIFKSRYTYPDTRLYGFDVILPDI